MIEGLGFYGLPHSLWGARTEGWNRKWNLIFWVGTRLWKLGFSVGTTIRIHSFIPC